MRKKHISIEPNIENTSKLIDHLNDPERDIYKFLCIGSELAPQLDNYGQENEEKISSKVKSFILHITEGKENIIKNLSEDCFIDDLKKTSRNGSNIVIETGEIDYKKSKRILKKKIGTMTIRSFINTVLIPTIAIISDPILFFTPPGLEIGVGAYFFSKNIKNMITLLKILIKKIENTHIKIEYNEILQPLEILLENKEYNKALEYLIKIDGIEENNKFLLLISQIKQKINEQENGKEGKIDRFKKATKEIKNTLNKKN